jgi:hypothetical protein
MGRRSQRWRRTHLRGFVRPRRSEPCCSERGAERVQRLAIAWKWAERQGRSFGLHARPGTAPDWRAKTMAVSARKQDVFARSARACVNVRGLGEGDHLPSCKSPFGVAVMSTMTRAERATNACSYFDGDQRAAHSYRLVGRGHAREGAAELLRRLHRRRADAGAVPDRPARRRPAPDCQPLSPHRPASSAVRPGYRTLAVSASTSASTDWEKLCS